MAHHRRIVLATFGSLGDLHPYIALAKGLRERGHAPVLATQESFRTRVESEGLGFHPVRPDVADFGDEAAVMRKVMDPKHGPEFVVREVLMAHLRQTYDDLSAAVEGADLLVTHPMTLAAQLVAEERRGRLAWASVALAPSSFLSAHDPPVFGPAMWLRWLRPFGPGVYRPLFRLIKRSVAGWVLPWHELRAVLGLPPTDRHPMFDGQFSPELTLAMFSPALGNIQPDWPPNTHLTGFPYYDGSTGVLEPALAAFLDGGEPPVVFTLGSAAVMAAGTFYEESLKAAQRIGRRAVLLTGRDPGNVPTGPLPEGVAVFEYAPYSVLLPLAAAVVHQGGVGTMAQALRAGRPMLVVPFGFDQPDNAARAVRSGVARSLAQPTYRAEAAARELTLLLSNPRYAARAAEIGRAVQNEDGVSAACRVIERHLAASPVQRLAGVPPNQALPQPGEG